MDNQKSIPVLFLFCFLSAGFVLTGCGNDPSSQEQSGQWSNPCLKWSLSGTWTASGTCGGDTGTITQNTCDVLLAVSQTGTCTGTISNDTINAQCTNGSTGFSCNITIQDDSNLSGTCTSNGGCTTTIARVP